MRKINGSKQLKKRISISPQKTKLTLKIDFITLDLTMNEAKEVSKILDKALAIIQTENTDHKQNNLLGNLRYKTELALHSEILKNE